MDHDSVDIAVCNVVSEQWERPERAGEGETGNTVHCRLGAAVSQSVSPVAFGFLAIKFGECQVKAWRIKRREKLDLQVTANKGSNTLQRPWSWRMDASTARCARRRRRGRGSRDCPWPWRPHWGSDCPPRNHPTPTLPRPTQAKTAVEWILYPVLIKYIRILSCALFLELIRIPDQSILLRWSDMFHAFPDLTTTIWTLTKLSCSRKGANGLRLHKMFRSRLPFEPF